MAALTCCPCLMRLKYNSEEIERLHRSKKIDRMIHKDKSFIRRQVKVLLLGAGESGKSTFIKQMKIIHGENFDEETVSEFRKVVFQNIIRGMKVLVDARMKLGLTWQNPDSCQYANHLLTIESNMRLEPRQLHQYFSSINELWKDKAIREAYHRRREFQLVDNVRYFFDNLGRISTPNYTPTNQDILHARVATKTITDYLVTINKIPFRFVDVGGQRSQRQKWFQCFEGVTSILFLVSSSEFDQVLLEDRCTNRISESRSLFETIVNNRCFSNVSVILFLNKIDLLKEKLRRRDTDISCYFQEFEGDPYDLERVQTFILSLFDSVIRNRETPFYYHYTTAVNTENIKVVFGAVKDAILRLNINSLMLQ